MSLICENLKLPTLENINLFKCVELSMSNGEKYILKENDLVGVQFIKNNKRILVRRGRIKDIVVINPKQLSTPIDNVSRIILDCSEQFTIKIIEIKLKDIIKIGGIDDEFEDYNDRIIELEPDLIEDNNDGSSSIPVRDHGMCSCEENKKITPDEDDIMEMDAKSGMFSDLVTQPIPSSNNKSYCSCGFKLTR